MSDQAYAKAQVQQKTLIGSPPRSNLLQRTCACGQHTIAGGECEACRKKREGTLQRAAIGSPPVGEAPPIVQEVLRSPGQPLDTTSRAFMEPRFGHDFSQIPTYTSTAGVIQTRLAINKPGDEYEQEADRMAEKTAAISAPTATSGYDFSGVRIHTDARAAASAEAVNAQAYTVGRDIVFGAGQYAPGTDEGRRLLAHELTHTLQQQSAPQIRRKLSVDPNLPGNAPPTDPSAGLTPNTRFAMMGTLIQSLCPKFKVDSNGDVVSSSAQSLDRADLAAGSNSTGCCCLSLLTEADQQWTIEVSSVIGAQTNFGSHQVFLNPTNTPVEFGAFTATNTLAFQGAIPTAGHELCGHAALEEVQAHPSGTDRLRTDVHDPTVRIENQISQEQGVPANELRGLARSGSHRGESVDKITISNFPLNVTNVPSSEQSKIRFAAQYIHMPGENDEFVSVLGHSDSAGSPAAKQAVSDGRAQKVKDALLAAGVPPTITKFGLPTTARFARVAGVSDSQPPPPPLDANQANWRRAEILVSGFPAGAQVPPAATPTTVAPHTQNPNVPALKASSDPCIKKLVAGAYP